MSEPSKEAIEAAAILIGMYDIHRRYTRNHKRPVILTDLARHFDAAYKPRIEAAEANADWHCKTHDELHDKFIVAQAANRELVEMLETARHDYACRGMNMPLQIRFDALLSKHKDTP